MIIIGGGRGGLTCGIYAKRAEMDVLMLEKGFPGGQVMTCDEIDNYPTQKGILGMDLATKFYEHATALGLNVEYEEVVGLEKIGNITDHFPPTALGGIKGGDQINFDKIFKINTLNKCFYSKTLVISTGASPKKINIPGEAEFFGKGVSYCATCDGAFYKGKDVAVIGGGDTAVGDAIYLSKICNKVHLIHRRDELRATKSLQTKAFNNDKIEIHWSSVPKSIVGESFVDRLTLENLKTKEEEVIPINGVFVLVGTIPNTEFVGDFVQTNKGYIVVDKNMETNVPGVFGVGDCVDKSFRQIITACADGALACFSAEKYV